MNNRQKGTSLVELAIAITIIGLLIAGTLGGVSLVKASKLRRVATEFTNYKTAVDTFVKEYQYLPGDLPIASSYWSGAHDGNGNSLVDGEGGTTNLEHLYVWEHLAKAEMIPGSYSGALTGGKAYVVGTSSPNSDGSEDLTYSFFSLSTATIYSTTGDHFRLTLPTADATANPWGGGMMGKDAYAIDSKMDDGKASSGMFYAWKPSGTGCTDAASTAASANYDLNSTVKSCNLTYWYKKF